MAIFRGLIYVKHGRVGSRSEGPDYHLQTAEGDYLLRWEDRFPWQPDYHLEHFCRRMVEVRGALADHVLQVETLHEILSPRIPRAQSDLEPQTVWAQWHPRPPLRETPAPEPEPAVTCEPAVR